MNTISTHILDTTSGIPAKGLQVSLAHRCGEQWQIVGARDSNGEGRISDFGDFRISAGDYRLTFAAGAYFSARSLSSFYDEIVIQFRILDIDQHYHVPLLLNPFGYSTYRGS